MLAPNSSYSISSLAALREVNSLTSPMTKTQAESVLASFVAKGWLLKSKCVDSFVCVIHESYLTSLITEHPILSSRKGRFSLSPRALLELQPYLKSTYPDEVLDCTICFEVGICALFKTPPPLPKRPFFNIKKYSPDLIMLTERSRVDPYARSRVSQGELQSPDAQGVLRDVPPVQRQMPRLRRGLGESGKREGQACRRGGGA